MGSFRASDYETVDQRIRRFYKDHPQGRITTELVSADGDIGKTRWVVKASVWRERIDGEPDGTGYAFEVDGTGMANKTSALENCDTSSVGRALAQIGYSGDKRATAEEMRKVQQSQVDGDKIIAAATSAKTKGEVRSIWTQARSEGAPQSVLDEVMKIAGDKPNE